MFYCQKTVYCYQLSRNDDYREAIILYPMKRFSSDEVSERKKKLIWNIFYSLLCYFLLYYLFDVIWVL